MGKRQLPTLVRLSLIVFFFFFFVHDNEAEYFLSIDGRVGKNEFTDVSFHAGCLGFFFFFFVWKLASCINHLQGPQGVLHLSSSRGSILVFFPSLFSISTVPLCLPCPRTMTFFRLSLILLSLCSSLSLSLPGYFVSICTVYPDLHRSSLLFLRLLLSPPEKVSLGSRLICTVSRNSETNSWEGFKTIIF